MLVSPKKNIISIIPALVFAIFTIVAVNMGLLFYPEFVNEYWHLEKLWPTFANTPTEEIFFAGILAALWTLLPKYLLNKKTEKVR